MPCDHCPCPDTCLAARDPSWGIFCRWAADPADPSQIRHIVARSAIGWSPEETTTEHTVTDASPDGPGFLTKAANFGKAIITHAVAGFPEVDDDTLEGRLTICRDCEFCDTENMICHKCGCGLSVKAKWETQTCPIGKW